MSLGGVEVKLPAKPARAGRGGKAAARAANKAKTAAEKAAIAEAAAARAAVALAAEAASSEADGDGDLTSHGAWRLILPHLPTSELINTLPCVCKALGRCPTTPPFSLRFWPACRGGEPRIADAIPTVSPPTRAVSSLPKAATSACSRCTTPPRSVPRQ